MDDIKYRYFRYDRKAFIVKVPNNSKTGPLMTKRYHLAVTAHFAVCVLAMVWPGALIANRVEPYVLGLPFLFFWYAAWMMVLFIGMWVAYAVRHGVRS